MESWEYAGGLGSSREGESIDSRNFEHALQDMYEPAPLPLPPSSDGDGAMLGRVLVYAIIVMVGIAMLLWRAFK
ncbi:MAG: hypothetical protein ABIR52_05735 [Casimicrobiaceae bacterium]